MLTTHELCISVRLTYCLAALLTCGVAVSRGDAEVIEYKLMYSKTQNGFGHQGVTKGPDGSWYVFCTGRIFKYPDGNFGAYQEGLVKNMKATRDQDFMKARLHHLGAPEYWQGKVYTYAKRGAYPPMRLVWFNANDLSYEAGSYRDITIPKAPDGGAYRVAGGPHIAGEFFYSALTNQERFSRYIGKFKFPSAEFVEFIPLKRIYHRPQGIDIDANGDIYIVETTGGVQQYSPAGVYKGLLYRHPKGGIHEGCDFDLAAKTLRVIREAKGQRYVVEVRGKDLHYTPGPGDVTPPTVPAGLKIAKKTASKAVLTWSAAIDPETGVERYTIFRDGKEVGMSKTPGFTDTRLSGSTTYAYQVAAYNKGGVASARSRPIKCTTPADTTPPTILGARFNSATNQLAVTFSEPLDKRSAENPRHYSVDNGVTVQAAALKDDQITVILKITTAMNNLAVHTLTVTGATDAALKPNPITPGSKTRYIPAGLVGRWTFDDVKGDVAPDSSGLGHHGKILCATSVAGKIGRALRFDGRGNVTIPSLDRTAFPVSGTLSVWVKGDFQDKANGRILGDGYDATRNHLFLRAHSGVKGLQAVCQQPDGYVFGAWRSLPSEQWYHVVFSWDTEKDKGYLSISGYPEMRDRISSRSWTPDAQRAIIGAGFKGLIDNVSLFCRYMERDEAEKTLAALRERK